MPSKPKAPLSTEIVEGAVDTVVATGAAGALATPGIEIGTAAAMGCLASILPTVFGAAVDRLRAHGRARSGGQR